MSDPTTSHSSHAPKGEQRRSDFFRILRKRPIIAAFRQIESLPMQALDHSDVLFILGGTIFDLSRIAEQARTCKKMVFVDIDLIKGIGKDAPGVRFLAQESQIDGIITTRSNLVKSAQKEGLISLQRIFVLDSESLSGGLGVITKSSPDAIEVLPGLVLPKIMPRIRSMTSIPIIAGGLITQEEEIREILASGAIAISTSSYTLLGLY